MSLPQRSSSSSLLERIQQAQQREQQQQPMQQLPLEDPAEAAAASATPSSGATVTNTAPATTAIESISNRNAGAVSNPSSAASSSMFGFFTPSSSASLDHQDASQPLLFDEPRNHVIANGNYTPRQYLEMFVMDVYTAFRSTHVVVQCIIVMVLVWIAWKLV